LGVCVEIRSRGEEEAYLEASVETSTPYFILEVWSGTRADIYEELVMNKRVLVDAGELGSIGRIGWFIPAKALDFNEALDSYRAYRTTEVAEHFSTNVTFPDGRFLGPALSWASVDETLINNLGLKLKVEYAQEADPEGEIIQMVEEHVNQSKPILFYFWTPHQLFAKLKLQRVFLPDYTAECYSAYSVQNGLTDCDYAAEPLKKLYNPLMNNAEHSSLAAFVQGFRLSTDEQTQLLYDVSYGGMTVEEASCAWVKQNENKWRTWIALSAVNEESFPLWSLGIAIPVVVILFVCFVLVTIMFLCMLLLLCMVQRINSTKDQANAPREGPLAIVFTDVQNSTLLWELSPELMKRALRTHNKIMGESLAKLRGYYCKSQGDSWMTAWKDPQSALDWCLRVQILLRHAPWDADLLAFDDCKEYMGANGQILLRGLRVRMGVHFGTPDIVMDSATKRCDYLGNMVNLSARAEAQAQGGEILATKEFIESVQDHIDMQSYETKLKGQFKLKGIDLPVSLFRIIAPKHALGAFTDEHLETPKDHDTHLILVQSTQQQVPHDEAIEKLVSESNMKRVLTHIYSKMRERYEEWRDEMSNETSTDGFGDPHSDQ